MSHSLLFEVLVYLTTAVLAVPIAKRLGLGSVLGYLLAGILVGPHALALVGNGEDVRNFAEFGIIMMLFLIGLELQPQILWKLRVSILGLGSLQVSVTAAILLAGAIMFGFPWKAGLAIGLTMAMSSTAIVLQSLQEKGLDKTAGGQSGLSVLLFQDIAVIPILALLPLLAPTRIHSVSEGGISALPPWLQALAVLGAVAAVITAGRFLARPAFHFIAGSRLREVFTAFALFLVIAITLLMELVGMSPALGAFLAGVVLADNEYRHELESDIEPFKGLLLGLFFLTVGAGVDLPYIAGKPTTVIALVAAVMATKALVLVGLARVFKLERAQGVLLAVSLCQVGEFAFVLLGLCDGLHILPGNTSRMMVAVVALSMVATPPLMMLLERVILARFARKVEKQETDHIESENAPVIIAGFGRMGNMIGRLLEVNGIRTTVLDLNPEVVDLVRKVGLKAYYGDASRMDLLHSAGASKAKILILAIDNPHKTLEIADTVKNHFPHLEIIFRAQERFDGYELLNRGHLHVFRETFGTSMDMGFQALRMMGFRGNRAYRAVHAFRIHNDAGFREVAKHWGDKKSYFSILRNKIREAEVLLRPNEKNGIQVDSAWDNTALREGIKEALGNPTEIKP